jgi:hypothetical protein
VLAVRTICGTICVLKNAPLPFSNTASCGDGMTGDGGRIKSGPTGSKRLRFAPAVTDKREFHMQVAPRKQSWPAEAAQHAIIPH